MGQVEEALAGAQRKAEELFAEVIGRGLIRPGVSESELSAEIHALAGLRFGVRRHWHKRVVRCGPNTVLTYHADPPDRRIEEDDIVYLDFGPLFERWEADFGRTYVLGTDLHKHRLVIDIATAFRRGKELYLKTPDLTAGALYDFVSSLATQAGWEFGAPTAGHLIGHFPHETSPADPRGLSIRQGNDLSLRAPDARGRPRHWILEIHFVDRLQRYGGFYEELLTI
jgi:Xaa-Pro dipeptidase